MIEAQGRTYHCTRQHICPMHNDTPSSFTRPNQHQDSPFTRPCSEADQQLTATNHQQSPAKPQQPHHIIKPTPSHCKQPPYGSLPYPSPYSQPSYIYSCIPYSTITLFKTILYSHSKTSTAFHPIPRPPMLTPAIIDWYLAHLAAINNCQTIQLRQTADYQHQYQGPLHPASPAAGPRCLLTLNQMTLVINSQQPVKHPYSQQPSADNYAHKYP